MEKLSPLGERDGTGTFDEFWDTEKYETLEEAIKANDTVIIDFVQDSNDIIFLEFYHRKNPLKVKHHRLIYQKFPFGLDVSDDNTAINIACKMLQENK